MTLCLALATSTGRPVARAEARDLLANAIASTQGSYLVYNFGGGHPAPMLNAGGSSGKENHLSGRSAFAKPFCHGIHFLASVTQILMRDAKIRSFQGGMNGKQGDVGTIPELVLGRCIRQISFLPVTYDAGAEHGNQQKPFLVSHTARLSVRKCQSEMT